MRKEKRNGKNKLANVKEMRIEKRLKKDFNIVTVISATSEEAFATSQELTAQATNMDELVGKFQLRA